MTTYSIFAKPEDGYAQDAIFVPDGFSWGGFVFTGLWALWNRMWIAGAIVISVSVLGSALPPAAQLLLNLAVSILMGLHGNDLLAWSLARRGYHEIGLSSGDSPEEAELRYYGDAAEISSASSPALKGFDALGLFGAKS
jgi:Protein of unknown function (DUF2628)